MEYNRPVKRVYVAGAYSGKDILESLDNMRLGIQLATDVMLAGFSPFCPFIDYHFFLQERGNQITMEQIKAYSIDFLRVCEALILTDNPRNKDSKGTDAEVALAGELWIPVFKTLPELVEYARQKK